MSFTSEPITRWLILKISQKFFNEENNNLIKMGRHTSGNNKERHKYFSLGSTIFTILGVGGFFVGISALAITYFYSSFLGYWWLFPLFAPGVIFYTIGLFFEYEENKAKNGVISVFNIKKLVFAIIIGLWITLLFIVMPFTLK